MTYANKSHDWAVLPSPRGRENPTGPWGSKCLRCGATGYALAGPRGPVFFGYGESTAAKPCPAAESPQAHQ
jgi:hypothetical protein